MSNKIAIYGVGIFGQIFRRCLDKIDFFIDDYSQENHIQNIPVVKLEQIPKDSTIYISPLQYSSKIEQNLKNNGFNHIINFTNSIKTIPNVLVEIAKMNYLWLTPTTKNIDKNAVDKVNDLLVDEKSKDILKNIINLRETNDTKYYIDPLDTEYFPSDIPMLKNLKQVNFIDCGAYVGDTIEELVNQKAKIGYTISFEPDSKNLIALDKTLNRLNLTNSIVYPAGVYSQNTILNFVNNGIDSSASIGDNSSIQIPVVTLDTVLLNSNPTFIKMDIEGAEKEALKGAKQIIQKYKPNMAICLYHKPEDIWELPLLVNEIEPSYDMYIRVHEDLCLSTVLYCVSKERDV